MLICGCRDAMSDPKLKDLYFRLVPVICAQLDQLPQEFFNNDTDLFASDTNFISRAMHDLIATAMDGEVSLQIRNRVLKLQELLVLKLGFKTV